jgi:VWFA-related protein
MKWAQVIARRWAFLIVSAALLTYGQTTTQQPDQSMAAQGAPAQQATGVAVSSTPQQPTPQHQPAATLRAFSRMVTVEVVARDHHGQPVRGLSQNDFQVFEKIGSKREQQKVAAFRAVSIADLANLDKGKLQVPAGVYTNFVTLQKVPVPPTLLLVDGLNTETEAQMQVHQQMIHMLAAIPGDVPVAVFLLGRQLKMIQSFTTDPKLLKAALGKISVTQVDTGTQIEPQDDPDAMSAVLENETNLPAGSLTALEEFEREVYAMQMDTRVRETLDALRAIARHVAGYPGRKNLLWISSSFPVAIDPDLDLEFAGTRNYQDQVAEVANALADAKVAVYPMDPAGLQTQGAFQSSTRMRGNPLSGRNSVARRMEREDQRRFNRQAAMQAIADQTGGTICLNDNDLADCIQKAVNDGSSFYELAYYPDSTKWHGEFHRLVIKSSKPGLRLSYRQGYFARRESESEQKSSDLQRAACQDLLTSTSVMIVAKAYPPDKPGEAKFSTAIYPTTVAFLPQDDGTRELSLKIGVCTFDHAGKPLQFMHQDLDARLTPQQYGEIEAHHGFPHTVVITPAQGTTSVRLLVKDLATGRMGSVNLPYVEIAAQAMTPPKATIPPTQP